jgi:transcriptional regulator with XRE-family HTH domain
MTASNPHALLLRARSALRLSQKGIAERLGASERTSVRWSAGSHPGKLRLARLAKLVHPVDRDLAGDIAESIGTTLAKLGLDVTATADARVLVSPRLALDAVVCAVAETLDLSPRVLRPALLAALRTMRNAGLAPEDAEKLLVEATTSKPRVRQRNSRSEMR